MRKILVTGAAGFIGFHLSKRLLDLGDAVTGLDNLNDYYDIDLKKSRLGQLRDYPGFTFHKADLHDKNDLKSIFYDGGFKIVVNMAAQAGVRYSLKNPHAYVDSNISGFLNILEGCRQNNIEHLVFASSSSVYGANTKMPFSEHQHTDHPVSLYGATKKANEVMAHAYAHLYGIPCTGLRFFTVYGPWGRPDMAYFLFTKAILEGTPINVFNHGKMKRDFTYVDDITQGVIRVMERPPKANEQWDGNEPDPASGAVPYKLYNIGNNNPVELSLFIEILERCLVKKAERNLLPMQPGDVPATYADIDDLAKDVGFRPSTPIEDGLKKFTTWYREYYGV